MPRRSGFSWRTILFTTALLAATSPARALEDELACCGELEKIVAELQAAVLGDGEHQLSLKVYGQVNRAILFWNDSFHSKAAFVDNTTSSSRLGFIGESKIDSHLVTGVRVEFEFTWPASSETYNPLDVTHAEDLTVAELRQAYGYVADDRLGTLTFGHQWAATGTITLINLGSQMNDAALHYNNAFSIGLSVAGGVFSDLKWGQIAHQVDTLRGLYLRYDSPSLHGFVLSASAGEDVSDVALRYRLDWQDYRFVAGIGYRDDFANQLTELKGGASLLHSPTGFYASVASSWRNDALSSIIGHPPSYFYYVQPGLSKQWLPFGNTTVYGDFGLYRNYNVGELLQVDPNTGQLVTWGTLTETEVVRWGYGIEQAFDKSGVLVYAQAHYYDPKIIGFPCDPNPAKFANHCGGDANNLVALPARPWSGFVAGARVRF
jgi:predicted porin